LIYDLYLKRVTGAVELSDGLITSLQLVLSFEGELVLFTQQQDYLVATYLLDVPL